MKIEAQSAYNFLKTLDSGFHPVMSGLRNAYIEMKNLEVA
jgi:hypothetical protein